MILKDKLFGVLLAGPIADITACVTTLICFVIFYKKVLSTIDKENIDSNTLVDVK